MAKVDGLTMEIGLTISDETAAVFILEEKNDSKWPNNI